MFNTNTIKFMFELSTQFFYAYSSLKEGVVKVSKEFNGLIELFNRDDNFYVLLKYINLALIQNDINSKIYTEEKGEFIYQYSLIECLWSFDECLNNSTKEELLLLKEEMAKILNYKISNPELFSVHSKGASLLLIANSLKKITPELKFSEETEVFINTGILNNYDVYTELLSHL